MSTPNYAFLHKSSSVPNVNLITEAGPFLFSPVLSL